MNIKLSKRATVVALALLLAVGSGSALAGPGYGRERRVIDDDWIVSLGGFLTELKTDAGVGAGGAVGTSIRAEEILGLDNRQTVVRLNGLYRFNDRHAISLGLWSLNRDGNVTIDEQIEFEGYLFDIDAELNSKFDTGWLRLDWRYSLLRADRGEAGIAIGISAYRFDIAIDGTATVSDGSGGTIQEEVRAAQEIIAPVPTIGMFINYTFLPDLVLRIHADFLDLQLGDIEGKLVDSAIELEWYFSRHVGCGLGINITNIDYRDTGQDSFLVDFRQSGLLGYFTFAF